MTFKHPPPIKQTLIMSCFLIMIGVHIPRIKKEIAIIHDYKKIIPHQKIGHKFHGLEKFTQEMDYIGYYTDKDLSKDQPLKEFTQAQYILAPTILDVNNLQHEYILFVCTNEINAWKKIRELKAKPLRRNKFGIILAQRKL